MRQRLIGNIFIGVLLGGALGYLCLTEDGRRLLSRAEPWLDDVMEEMRRLQGAATKARQAIEQGRESIDVVMRMAGFDQDEGEAVH